MACSDEEHSRKILSYWTAERIKNAHPEPDPDFIHTGTEPDPGNKVKDTGYHTDAISSYWTRERLVSATPEAEPLACEDQDEIDTPTATGEVEGFLEIVPDDKVVTFPYQSVGKLFYTKGTAARKRHFHASGWVANISTEHHVVLTAAHCLEGLEGSAENIYFIPGFIPPHTEPFGRYPQMPGGQGIAWAVNPNWDPQHVFKYDQAVIKLDKDPSTGKYVDEVVKAIQIVSNQTYLPNSEWNTIGYPVARKKSDNPDGKMVERSGKYYRRSRDGGSVYKYGNLVTGVSGGPWILTGSGGTSNGVHFGSIQSGSFHYAVSSYFKYSVENLLKFF